MKQAEISSSLTKIIIFWENITREKSDDKDAYDYIANQTMSLRMIAFQLGDSIENLILGDKPSRLKYQKLQRALNNIVTQLDFELRTDKDKKYIEGILMKLAELKDEISVIRQYQ